MSLRGPIVEATRQEQGLSGPEWPRNVQKKECDGKIREGCWQKREERHATEASKFSLLHEIDSTIGLGHPD
jgi:hypothetical protein